jgi:hypothetical protein
MISLASKIDSLSMTTHLHSEKKGRLMRSYQRNS